MDSNIRSTNSHVHAPHGEDHTGAAFACGGAELAGSWVDYEPSSLPTAITHEPLRICGARTGRALRETGAVAIIVSDSSAPAFDRVFCSRCAAVPARPKRAHNWSRERQSGQVAQVVERSPEKAGVGGSTPSLATIIPKHLALFTIVSLSPQLVRNLRDRCYPEWHEAPHLAPAFGLLGRCAHTAARWF